MTEKNLSFRQKLSRLFKGHSKKPESSQPEITNELEILHIGDVIVRETEAQIEDKSKVSSESFDDFVDAQIIDLTDHGVKEAQLKNFFKQIVSVKPSIQVKDLESTVEKLKQFFNIVLSQDCIKVTVTNPYKMETIINKMPKKEQKKIKEILNRLKNPSKFKIEGYEVEFESCEKELQLEEHLKQLFPKENCESLAIELAQCFALLPPEGSDKPVEGSKRYEGEAMCTMSELLTITNPWKLR